MKTNFGWLKDQLAAPADQCVNWPFSVKDTGYGQLNIKGAVVRAHRIMCELAHGEPPAGTNDAAHSCGNRLCVNPHHLRWASRKENEADKLRHGTAAKFTAAVGIRNGRAKLNDEAARLIFASHGTEREIARSFGVTRGTVRAIKAGLTWRNATGARG